MPSNHPQMSYRNWTERACSRPEFRTAKEQLSVSAREIDTLFFGVRTSTEGAAGIYVELYYESIARVLSACMFTFVAPEDGFLVEEAIKVSHVKLDSPVQQFIELNTSTARGGAYWFAIRMELLEHTPADIRLCGASARLHKNYSAASPFNNPKILPTTLPNRDQNLRVFGRLLSGGRLFCPNCSGIGAFDDMAIPKADWESGATGYALYSCNRVSGRVACSVCGGSGGRFASWYIEERPELSGAGFVAGSGIQPRDFLIG